MRTPPKCVGGKRREKASCMDRHFVRRYAACAKERERERERRERERGERENEENRQSVRRARGRAREREREENSHARRGDAQHACRPGRAATFNVIMACSMRSSHVGALYGAVSAVAVWHTIVPLRLTRPRSGATQSVRFRAPNLCPGECPKAPRVRAAGRVCALARAPD